MLDELFLPREAAPIDRTRGQLALALGQVRRFIARRSLLSSAGNRLEPASDVDGLRGGQQAT